MEFCLEKKYNNFMLNRKWLLIILVLATFLAYINVYQNVFLSDDLDGILRNKNIGNLEVQIKSASPVNIINSLIYLGFGAKEPYFHFVNVLLHIFNVLLLYFIVSELSNKKLAFVTGLLFALHPVHTEAVTWISGKPYVLYSFFILLSFVLYIKRRYLILSYLFYILSLLTMEKAIMFPGLIILYLLSFDSLKKRVKSIIPYLGITFLYGLTLIWRLPERVASVNPPYGPGVSTNNPIIQTGTAISSYLELFIAPIRLTFYHDTASISNQVLMIRVLTMIIFLTVTALLYKKNKLLFFGLSFFVIAISPTLIPISVGWIVAERYFYLGSAGLCLFLAYLILKLKRYAMSAFVIILIFYFGLTIKRNEEWRNEDRLWPATVKYSYGVPVAHNNMGDYYIRHGDYENAIKEFSLAINQRNWLYPEAIHNLGNAYKQIGDLDRAEGLYLKAIELKPDQFESYVQLSDLYKTKGDLVRAGEYYQKAKELMK